MFANLVTIVAPATAMQVGTSISTATVAQCAHRAVPTFQFVLPNAQRQKPWSMESYFVCYASNGSKRMVTFHPVNFRTPPRNGLVLFVEACSRPNGIIALFSPESSACSATTALPISKLSVRCSSDDLLQ